MVYTSMLLTVSAFHPNRFSPFPSTMELPPTFHRTHHSEISNHEEKKKNHHPPQTPSFSVCCLIPSLHHLQPLLPLILCRSALFFFSASFSIHPLSSFLHPANFPTDRHSFLNETLTTHFVPTGAQPLQLRTSTPASHKTALTGQGTATRDKGGQHTEPQL